MQIIYFYSFFVNYSSNDPVVSFLYFLLLFLHLVVLINVPFWFAYPIHNRLEFHEHLSLPHNPHNLSMTCLNDLLLVSRQLSLNTAIFYCVSILFFNIVCIIAIVDLFLSYNQHFGPSSLLFSLIVISFSQMEYTSFGMHQFKLLHKKEH